jgi:hypothetical protein
MSFDSLPTAKITNPDVTRIINSDEIQSIVRRAHDRSLDRPRPTRKNPLVNKSALYRLNPYAKTLRQQELGTFSPSLFTLMMPNDSASYSETSQEEGRQG